jgi:type I restriction enzyme R subunit
MATTDTSEKGLEDLICVALTGTPCSPTQSTADEIGEASLSYTAAVGAIHEVTASETSDVAASYNAPDYVCGDPKDYNREHAIDLAKLLDFLQATQYQVVEKLGLAVEGPRRRKFLARLQGEISKRGVVDVLRNGFAMGPIPSVVLFYGSPSPGNVRAAEQYDANVFSITRQLCYSRDETRLALDLGLFVNGLPVATFELKNRLTRQTAADAKEQYKRDRKSSETLFKFGRCLVHFALDDEEVYFCTHLKGKESWFLPFNKGYQDGAGNPPNAYGIKTDYLWRQILTRKGLTDILENYAQVVTKKDPRTGCKKKTQIFPRYHQLDVVHKLLDQAQADGPGQRYLIQHSTGSGKSYSIAWLTHQLVGLRRQGAEVFDTVIVVTDRRILDKQIRDTIQQFAQVSSTVGAVTKGSGQLRRFIESGKRIIITTVQKFPHVLDQIGDVHRDRTFAIVIDEAHSSQGGRTSAKMNIALSAAGGEVEAEETEDVVNRLIETRKMLPNASYFAFTATPKNKTLEVFGKARPEGEDVKHDAFHTYTMKQAIQEGFILDVLAHYTPLKSFYRLAKTVGDDPEFDTKKAQKKLRRYVESHSHATGEKAAIMVDHFHDQVLAKQKIGGQARAMVVTDSIERAIRYYHAIEACLKERKSPWRAIVAFSGAPEYEGRKVTEAGFNGFPSSKIAERFREDPYRFLVCADKFQTGYDEPLLHTMYVDKKLSDIKAVQTLSRLNRADPKKHDTFVLDFMNDAETIQRAFARYYRTTILSSETDPDKLHDLKADLEGYRVYGETDVGELVERYLGGADRDRLDPILDVCVTTYTELLDEDGQVDFKSKAKVFVRTYNFLASILPFGHPGWEKLSIFLSFLVPKLPAPQEQDLSRGILETVDMDSYRVEARSAMRITLEDEDAEIDPAPASGGASTSEAELDRLSNILREFNEQFAIDWNDADKVSTFLTEELPAKVAADPSYQNAVRNSDEQNARIEHDKVLQRILVENLSDFTQLFKHFSDDPSFRKGLTDAIFAATYQATKAGQM